MPASSEHYVRQFVAHDTEGNDYVIKIYQTTIEVKGTDQATGWKLKTTDNRTATKQLDGTYTIPGIPDITLTSDDPKAF